MTRRRLAYALSAALAALVIIIPLVIGLGSRPAPRASATAAPEPLPSASPSPNEDSDAVPILDEELVLPGQTAKIAGVDHFGVWGSIELTRGEDTGGYPHHTVGADVFVVEILVEYFADRVPEVERSGDVDWTLAMAGSAEPIGQLIIVPSPPDPDDFDPYRQPFSGGYSRLIDVLTVPARGMLTFEVPRAAADQALVLLYRPETFPTAVLGITVREPGLAPDPVAAATPVPTPRPLTYVSRAGPLTVIESAAADALFESPDECTNPVDGYRVTYPDNWYTNTQIADSPPCSWFSPTYYELTLGPPWPPSEIVIILDVFDGGFGSTWSPVYTVDESVAVDGFAGMRREVIAECFPGPCRSEPPLYYYVAYIGDPYIGDPVPRSFGLTMVARAPSERSVDYELTKAVLDRIMASIEFLP